MAEDMFIKKEKVGRWQLTKFKPKVEGHKATSNLQFGRQDRVTREWKNDNIKFLFDDNLKALKDLLDKWFADEGQKQ